MEANLSFCEGKHLSPVTNKQINEFVDLLRRSVVLQELYNGRKNVKKRIKMIALRKKKRTKGGLKEEKSPKRHLRGWNTSPCAASRVTVGLTTSLSEPRKETWDKLYPRWVYIDCYCSLLWVSESWLINEPVRTPAFSASITTGQMFCLNYSWYALPFSLVSCQTSKDVKNGSSGNDSWTFLDVYSKHYAVAAKRSTSFPF